VRLAPGRAPLLAIGDDVADALEAARPDAPPTRASDVHAALLRLVDEGPRAVVVAPHQLVPRPRAALRALRRAAAPHPVVVLAAGPADARVDRAATALGVRHARTAADVLSRPSGHVAPEAASTPRTTRARSTLDEVAFVDGCFRRLERGDDLCRFVVGAFGKASGAARISLLLVDPARSALFVKAARGLDAALVGRLRMPLASGVAGRATTMGRAIAGRAMAGGPRGYAGTAYAVLPLGAAPRCEGVVALTDLPQDALPDRARLRALLRMARRAGRALSASRRIEQAEMLSATDELTGLPNRRAFERALHREVERARRGGTPLAVGLVDVVHFKGFNDRFGHPVGERVLAQVARRLTSALRETDLVARWGGEEFAVLLTGLSEGTPDEALVVLERARTAVGTRPLALGPGLPCPMVTVSGGVAVLPRDGADGATLVHKADAALYEAKRAGRNRVLHA
jgi:diguanylate cyclase (GGDEF)-like protein